jgi:hypothetical protein
MRHRQPSGEGTTPRRSKKAIALSGILAQAAIGVSGTTHAEPAPSTLIEWQAPDSCPGANVVYQRVSTLLGYAPSDWGAVDHVRGTINEQPQHWLLTIDMQRGGERSSRVISAPRCDDLAEAAAIAIVLALENEAPQATRDGTADDGSKRIGARTSAAGTNPSVDQAAVAPRREAVPVGFSVAGDALLDFDSLGSVAPGASVSAAARFGRAQLALYGLLLAEQRRTLNTEQFITFGLLAAGLRGCYRVLDSPLSGAACAGLEAGRLQVESRGVDGARGTNDLWLAPSAALELGATIRGPLEAHLRFELLRPLPRKQYAINETDVLYRPPVLAPRAYIGLSWAPD